MRLKQLLQNERNTKGEVLPSETMTASKKLLSTQTETVDKTKFVVGTKMLKFFAGHGWFHSAIILHSIADSSHRFQCDDEDQESCLDPESACVIWQRLLPMLSKEWEHNLCHDHNENCH